MKTMETSISSKVTGCKSPKPTVVRVMKDYNREERKNGYIIERSHVIIKKEQILLIIG
jgi:hypothetical protein